MSSFVSSAADRGIGRRQSTDYDRFRAAQPRPGRLRRAHDDVRAPASPDPNTWSPGGARRTHTASAAAASRRRRSSLNATAAVTAVAAAAAPEPPAAVPVAPAPAPSTRRESRSIKVARAMLAHLDADDDDDDSAPASPGFAPASPPMYGDYGDGGVVPSPPRRAAPAHSSGDASVYADVPAHVAGAFGSMSRMTWAEGGATAAPATRTSPNASHPSSFGSGTPAAASGSGTMYVGEHRALAQDAASTTGRLTPLAHLAEFPSSPKSSGPGGGDRTGIQWKTVALPSYLSPVASKDLPRSSSIGHRAPATSSAPRNTGPRVHPSSVDFEVALPNRRFQSAPAPLPAPSSHPVAPSNALPVRRERAPSDTLRNHMARRNSQAVMTTAFGEDLSAALEGVDDGGDGDAADVGFGARASAGSAAAPAAAPVGASPGTCDDIAHWPPEQQAEEVTRRLDRSVRRHSVLASNLHKHKPRLAHVSTALSMLPSTDPMYDPVLAEDVDGSMQDIDRLTNEPPVAVPAVGAVEELPNLKMDLEMQAQLNEEMEDLQDAINAILNRDKVVRLGAPRATGEDDVPLFAPSVPDAAVIAAAAAAAAASNSPAALSGASPTDDGARRSRSVSSGNALSLESPGAAGSPPLAVALPVPEPTLDSAEDLAQEELNLHLKRLADEEERLTGNQQDAWEALERDRQAAVAAAEEASRASDQARAMMEDMASMSKDWVQQIKSMSPSANDANGANWSPRQARHSVATIGLLPAPLARVRGASGSGPSSPASGGSLERGGSDKRLTLGGNGAAPSFAAGHDAGLFADADADAAAGLHGGDDMDNGGGGGDDDDDDDDSTATEVSLHSDDPASAAVGEEAGAGAGAGAGGADVDDFDGVGELSPGGTTRVGLLAPTSPRRASTSVMDVPQNRTRRAMTTAGGGPRSLVDAFGTYRNVVDTVARLKRERRRQEGVRREVASVPGRPVGGSGTNKLLLRYERQRASSVITQPGSAFAGLSQEDAVFLVENCNILVFHPEEYLAVQGEHNSCMFLLIEGHVAVTVFQPDGSEKEILRRYHGQVIGEFSLISDAPRTAK